MNPQPASFQPANLLRIPTEAREVLRRLTGIAHAEFHDDWYEGDSRPGSRPRPHPPAYRLNEICGLLHFFLLLRAHSMGPARLCLPAAPSCVIGLRRHPALRATHELTERSQMG